MNRYAEFWDIEIERVPMMTGAGTVMDASDLQVILDNYDVDLSEKLVFDVGCGTGRLSQLCGSYRGFDITPAMVEYTRQSGIRCDSMEEFTTDLSADMICCFSVFTHIQRSDRQEYLKQFIQIAPEAIVDIVPSATGEDHGDVAIWYADPKTFQKDIRSAGYRTASPFRFGRIPEDGVDHIYYFLRR